MSQPPVRPREASISGGLIVLGSLAVVGYAFAWMGRIGSMDFQQEAATLIDGPLRDSGMSVDDVQTVARALGFVTAGVGAAVVVLGVYLLRRSRPARVALSVLAPVLLVAGFEVAPLPVLVVTGAVVALWLQPTRGWLATSGTPDVLAGSAGGPPPAVRAAPAPSVPQAPSVAPTQATPHPTPWPPDWSAGWSAYAAPTPDRRPGQVVAACVVTWVAAALVAGLSVLVAIVLTVSPDDLHREVQPQLDRANVSFHDVTVGAYVFVGIAIVWGAAACVFALAAFRRRSWGRTALLVCALAVTLVSLLSLLLQPLAIVTLAAGAATTILLQREQSRRWYAAPRE